MTTQPQTPPVRPPEPALAQRLRSRRRRIAGGGAGGAGAVGIVLLILRCCSAPGPQPPFDLSPDQAPDVRWDQGADLADFGPDLADGSGSNERHDMPPHLPELPDLQPDLPDLQPDRPDAPSPQRPPPPRPKRDVCPNLPGVQERVPDGHQKNERGDCVPVPPPKPDFCLNLPGVQDAIPAGHLRTIMGECIKLGPGPTPQQEDRFQVDCGTLAKVGECRSRCLRTEHDRKDCDELYGPGRIY